MAVGQIPKSPSGKDKHSQCQPKKAPEPIFEEKELNFEPKLAEDLIDLFEFPEIEVELEVEEWRYCGSLLKRV